MDPIISEFKTSWLFWNDIYLKCTTAVVVVNCLAHNLYIIYLLNVKTPSALQDTCNISEVGPVIHEISSILRLTAGQSECGYIDTGPELHLGKVQTAVQDKYPNQLKNVSTYC